MESCKIIFRRSGEQPVVLELFSHYTCIVGDYSGEGKSEFVAMVEDGISDDSVIIEADYPVDIANAGSLEGLLGNPERRIIIVDELAMLKSSILTKVNKSQHLFIGISRAMPLKLDYPLKGIYQLKRSGTWFKIIQMEGSLPKFLKCSDCVTIMEAAENRSEHQLLSKYFSNTVSASGRDNIEKYLRKSKGRVQVFADLGAVGRAFFLLRKRCMQNPEICFYDYQSFEHLLSESPLLRDKVTKFKNSVFDYFSLERYYEDMLEKSTQNDKFPIQHGKPLPDYVLSASENSLFNSGVGKVLLDYIDKDVQKFEGGLSSMNLFKSKHTKC